MIHWNRVYGERKTARMRSACAGCGLCAHTANGRLQPALLDARPPTHPEQQHERRLQCTVTSQLRAPHPPRHCKPEQQHSRIDTATGRTPGSERVRRMCPARPPRAARAGVAGRGARAGVSSGWRRPCAVGAFSTFLDLEDPPGATGDHGLQPYA
eukprot:1756342-Prymnesium_polylepis.1